MPFQKVYTISAIILKRRNWGETDRLITVFSREYGKIRLIAKGVRKLSSRRSAHLEPFCPVIITVHRSRNSDIVTEAVSDRTTPENIRIDTIGYSYYLCELVDRLTPEGEKHEDIYQLLRDSLNTVRIGTDPENCSHVADVFANEILRILGYRAPDRMIEHENLTPYIENVIEKRLKSPKIISRMAQ